MKKLKMDEVDTEQQKQIDWLIIKLSMVSAILVIWCACLTVAVVMIGHV